MKKILLIALVLLMSACCLTSCDKIEQEIGKTVSVAAVDAVATEFADQGVEFERMDAQDLEEFAADWNEQFGADMEGDITSGLVGDYTNQATGEWVKYWVFGFSATEDAETLTQKLNEEYKVEIEEGKAVVVNGGYIVNLTLSSVKIDTEGTN